jgi:hypothetical protein
LVVTRNRHGNLEPLVTNDLDADLSRVVARKHSRWSVETIFRDTKQYAGLGACQCWTDQAMVRHVGLVLLGFVVLQQLRLNPAESVAAVKERWQLTLTRQGQAPPTPLKACPAHLRATAQVLSIELFFDLVFVYAVTQTVSLVHEELSWAGVADAVIVFWLVCGPGHSSPGR